MSTSSDRGNARINESGIGNPVENTEKAITDSPAVTGSYGLYRQERRKGHQVISTSSYYQVERRGGGIRYGYGETQDWSDPDTESDGMPYSGRNF
ncbi:hypothetical protein SAMN05216404_101375 [Nitrosospira multiformis]|uniref:Uncharacterized protein n=1 Tax=Nitrosospira multiformis TaxID=1231 RepID=A0A1H8BZF5_9PROT|nr:hypothetical protein [Nitrosospira multiformis]SEM87237.1 hypothetical protein SAMN05216404_101375 [Nitrosospira multiformis]